MDKEILALLVRAKDEASDNFEKIRKSLSGIHDHAEKASKGLGAVGTVLHGIGTGAGIRIFDALTDVVGRLANAIPDLINRGLQFTNLVDQLGDATGASAEESSRLIGTYQLLGISVDTLGTRMGLLARVVTSNEATVNRYGIATRDANGNLLNQVQIVENARHHLSQYESGTAKAAMMIKLFGRAGLDMADFLALSDEQVQLISKDLEKMGVVLGTDAAKQAEAAKIEMRRFDLSLQGLANTLLANILPSLIPAISGITNFVSENGQAIGIFMAQVVNFVMGVVSALTGAKFSAVSFTDQLGEVGGAASAADGALDDLATTQQKGAGTSKAAVEAYQEQIAHLDRMTQSVERLDAAQDKRFEKEIDRLTATVDREKDAIDAADRRRSVEEQRAAMVRDIADAEAAVAAAADPEAQADAVRRLNDLKARSAEFEVDQADATRQAELDQVRAFIEAMATAETEWASKKGLIEQMKKNEAVLNSQIAAATEAGDLQRVADLNLQLEAVKAVERRAQMAQANIERTKELDDQKLRYQELVKAAQSAGSGIGAGISAGAGAGGAAIEAMTFEGEANMRRLGSAINGEGGITQAMADAQAAGVEFGNKVKDAIDKASRAVSGLLDIFEALANFLGEDVPKRPGGFLKGGDVPFDALNPEPMPVPSFDQGGIVPGRRGEPQIMIAHGGERVTPEGQAASASVTFYVTMHGVQDPQQFLQELKREVDRQGVSLVPA